MNLIAVLLREQKEEFEKKFTAFGNVYADQEAFTNWHTTAQQQLIDVIIGMMEKELENTSDYSWDRYSRVLLKKIITLLEEAKKDI